MPLTDAQIKSFKPAATRIRKADGQGLFLEITPSGRKVFRLAYRFDGKQKTVVIGDYPTVKLADARLRASEHKQKLRDGFDPQRITSNPMAVPVGPLWKAIALDYVMLRQRSGAAPKTMQKLDRQIHVTIKHLGHREIRSIKAQDVLNVVNPIAERGQVETAHEIRSRFSQVFRYAAARGLVEHDPAALTIDAMVARRRGEFAGITDPAEVRQLMKDIHAYRDHYLWVGSALLLSAYLFPRNTELRGMRWDEIDWDRKVWEIPSVRMKMKLPHLIPLPQQALAVLQRLKDVDVGSEYVLPAPRDPRKMLSDNTFNAALRKMGYAKEQHVHHGFRTTASTNLNELGWNSDWVERQLAHVPANKVRSSYNKAQYWDGRVQMMGAWAVWLEED